MNGDPRWLVWSIEHDSWWRPGGRGYTKLKREAGRFTLEDAVANVHSGFTQSDVPEEAIFPDFPVIENSREQAGETPAVKPFDPRAGRMSDS